MKTERQTQRDRILRLLLDARGEWVALPRILELQIAQYSARICELRRAGFAIENRVEMDAETGQRRSWFRLPGPPTSPLKPSEPISAKNRPGPSPFERAHAKDSQREAERLPLFAEVRR